MIEGVSGRGGLPGLIMWMQQLSFVPNIASLVNNAKSNLIAYDTALLKCAKEALKRPEFMREEEIATMLGYTCNKCGKRQPAMSNNKTCSCKDKGTFELTYLSIYDELDKLDIIPTPEAVMMTYAFDCRADAYVQAFQAFRLVLETISTNMNWNISDFVDLELKDQLDSNFLFYSPGDTRQAIEERALLMFLIRGNIATKITDKGKTYLTIDLPEAEKLIRLMMDVLKFGYLYNQLNCAGADAQFSRACSEYMPLYNEKNEEIRLTITTTQRERGRRRTVQIEQLEDQRFFACALLPSRFWENGKLSDNLFLEPLVGSRFQISSDDENLANNLFLSPSGGGKTTFMGAIIKHAIEYGHEYVLNILSDEKNGLSLAGIPLFPCEGKTGALIELLSEIGVQPKAIPCLNLTFLRVEGEEEVENLHANPPTIFDRIIEIDEPWSFGLKFWNTGSKVIMEKEGTVGNRGILNILEEFARKMSYPEHSGLINVRNLLREEKSEYEKETRPDIQIATLLFQKFLKYRQDDKQTPARINMDEMSISAPVQHTIAGSDTAKSSATLGAAIKALRGVNASFDGATQRFTELDPKVVTEGFNVFFRELSQSKNQPQSQRDMLLGALDLTGGKAEREAIATMMEKKTFPKDQHLWFWYNKLRGTIQVVRPNPPPFMISQPRKTNLEVLRSYQRFSGETVLLDSWKQVPHLRYEPERFVKSTRKKSL